MSMHFFIAEFDKQFLDLLSATADAAPLELFSNPKIYLHNLLKHDSFPEVWQEATELHATLQSVGFGFHPKLETEQLVAFLNIEGAPKNYAFAPYVSLVNDAYRNKSSRRFSRSLITSLIEMHPQLTLKVSRVDSESESGKIILDVFSEVTMD